MVAEIRWSENAIEDYRLTVEYLLVEWNESVASKFVEIIEYRVRQIAIHPHIGLISSKDKNIRSILLTKHNRLYYRIVSGQIIEVINIFDTRQDPGKNKFQ